MFNRAHIRAASGVLSLALMLFIFNGTSVRAADTDIYFFTDQPDPQDEPLVMFSLDWRPNLNGTAGGCTSLSEASCPQFWTLKAEGFLDVAAGAKVRNIDYYVAVLRKVFAALGNIGLKVGLMVSHDAENCAGPQTGNNTCTNGGFIAMGFKSLSQGGGDELLEKLTRIAKMNQNGTESPSGQGHSYQGAELFFEFYRYLTGGGIYNGHNGWRSFDDGGTITNPYETKKTLSLASFNLDDDYQRSSNQDPSSCTASSCFNNLGLPVEYGRPHFSWDTNIETGSHNQYVSPLVALTGANCGPRIYTVNIMFQVANQDNDSDSEIAKDKSQGGMGFDPSSNKAFEEVIGFLNKNDLGDGTFGAAPDLAGSQHVVSYFLVKNSNITTNKYAKAGGTGQAITMSDDPETLVKTITNIFNSILSISTSFVSASVSVNTYNRAEILNQVYLGLFQPKSERGWPGNVKKLKIGEDAASGDLYLYGQGGTGTDKSEPEQAVSIDGRLKFDVLTFWTDSAKLPNKPDPNITGNEADLVVNGADGRFVPRGGAGQQIPGLSYKTTVGDPGLVNSAGSGRKLFYDTPGSGVAPVLAALNADDANKANTALQTALGVVGETDAEKQAETLCLLKYIRGYAVQDDCSATAGRSWMLGDVLHSRPVVVNYGGSASNPDVYLMFGGNDGFFRMIRNTTSGGAESGQEMWAFMPRAVMDIVSDLKDNGEGEHLYGVDGVPSAYVFDNDRDGNIETSDGDKVWVFFGLRRGGNAYYGLDVSIPGNPSLLWRIDSGDTDFAQLGLTFSRPQVAILEWDDDDNSASPAITKPVVIFGGGYDPDKDRAIAGDPSPIGDDDEGNALFVVDAQTGALVWKATQGTGISTTTNFRHADLQDSIPADVAVIDANDDGRMDRAYVGDTGGVLWRVNFASGDRSQWNMVPLLSVGRHSEGGTGPDRRFMHRPDVALSEDANGNFEAVVIGSGDRENPLETAIRNEFYLLKDRSGASGSCNEAAGVCERTDLADLTNNCLQDDNPDGCSFSDVSVGLYDGWYVSLTAGEKVLSSPLTIAGSTLFTTYLPPDLTGTSLTCGAAEGGGRFYALDVQTAKANLNLDESIDPITGNPTIDGNDVSVQLTSGGIPSDIVALFTGDTLDRGGIPILRPDLEIGIAPATTRWRTFWQQDIDE